jgi:hypothetical protein
MPWWNIELLSAVEFMKDSSHSTGRKNGVANYPSTLQMRRVKRAFERETFGHEH